MGAKDTLSLLKYLSTGAQLFTNPGAELELEATRVNLRSSSSRQLIDNVPFSFDFPPPVLLVLLVQLVVLVILVQLVQGVPKNVT